MGRHFVAFAGAAVAAVLASVGGPLASPDNGRIEVVITDDRARVVTLVITDPDGIRNWQITSGPFGRAQSSVEATGNGACETRVAIRVGALNDHPHPHRVVWVDCQHATERDRTELPATEVWDVSQEYFPRRHHSQESRTPHVVNIGGGTRFFGVIAGTDAGVAGRTNKARLPCDEKARQMTESLRSWPGWGNLGEPLTDGDGAVTRAAVVDAVEDAKRVAQPGDEFLFFFCDHGSNDGADDPPLDEPDGHDGRMFFDGEPRSMTDDALATLLSGFRPSVTITVVLDICFAGDFVTGGSDVLSAADATGSVYDKDHLSVLMSTSGCQLSFNAKFAEVVAKALQRGSTTRDTKADTTKADGDYPRNPSGKPAHRQQLAQHPGNGDGITTALELFNAAAPKATRPGEQHPLFAFGVGP